ncbi:hypothetical protein BU23DRAFT_571172 [Bimuria novae-zelandiae CBS 107.79]|uniref:DUF6594 domain-containing protein n=1 Tax=Bimuria novae-zelandiae CBS 107.79 TaxID=1447943 RepID=A0A6A5V0W2_9PLEO|nr:hypothetical protein BU23DRAFT_571172 [Bimuria novae-zelandiae CBS 107.79]
MAPTTPKGPAAQVDHGYNILYENISIFPWLARFRRFRPQWAKLIHDDTEEVLFYEARACEELSKRIPTESSEDRSKVTVLDIPRHIVKEKYPDIYKSFWVPYEEALRQHGRDICTSSQVMQLPGQAAGATKHLAIFKPWVFKNDRFGVTQERVEYYLNPSDENDAFVWKEPELPQLDYFSDKIVDLATWIEDHVFERFRGSKASEPHGQSPRQLPPRVRYQTLVETMDYLTCIIASVLLMGALFALDAVDLPKGRIGLVGGLGTVFSLSVKFLTGPSRRIEVHAHIIKLYKSKVVNNGSGDGAVVKNGTLLLSNGHDMRHEPFVECDTGPPAPRSSHSLDASSTLLAGSIS